MMAVWQSIVLLLIVHSYCCHDSITKDVVQNNDQRQGRRSNYRCRQATPQSAEAHKTNHRRLLRRDGAHGEAHPKRGVEPKRRRLLYIVTSIHEFDDGKRNTVAGYDRFANTLVPVLRESTITFINEGQYDVVDLFLIAHYQVGEGRVQELRTALDDRVGIEIWDDATPIGYVTEDEVPGYDFAKQGWPKTDRKVLAPVTRALARQHRYVIKDKLLDYDLFVNFEDDMLIREQQVSHFVDMTDRLYRLRQDAQDTLDDFVTLDEAYDTYYGPMTKIQLGRMLPGFIRVEAKLPDFQWHVARKATLHQRKIPINYDYASEGDGEDGANESGIDPSVCCRVPMHMVNEYIPASPNKDELLFWETDIEALGIRQMPRDSNSKDFWVLLQAGNTDQYYEDAKFVIGDYWTGRSGYFGADTKRPDPTEGRYLNNQGGWMATRRQISEWHTRWCVGRFLPPYDRPIHPSDGLTRETVEYWSGGIQIVGVKACNLQRVIDLHPKNFSKHLLYHVSNNKQKFRPVQRQMPSESINQFWGQLNTIKEEAEHMMQQEQTNRL